MAPPRRPVRRTAATSCAVPRLSALSLAFCMAASAFCLASTAASSAFCAAPRAKLLAEANMPDMEEAAFSAGSIQDRAA